MNCRRGSIKNPLEQKETPEGFFEYVHIYQTKGNMCIKPICLDVYVKADTMGKHCRSYFFGKLRQSTVAERATCPDCIKAYFPIYIKKSQKYLKSIDGFLNKKGEKNV